MSGEHESHKSGRSHRTGRRKNRKVFNKTALIIFLFGLLCLGIVGVAALFDAEEQSTVGSETPVKDDVSYEGKEYTRNQSIETVLVMGVDAFSDSLEEDKTNGSYVNHKQADFLLLLVVDNAKKECRAIHINRDTITKVNKLGVAGEKITSVELPIAVSFNYGSTAKTNCRNTCDAVSELLNNVPINYYVAMTMDAVPIVNDAVGGVTVKIEDDFSQIDTDLIQGEEITLLGEKSLTFIRSRGSMGNDRTNLNRMKRQKTYLNSLYEKLRESANSDKEFIKSVLYDVWDSVTSNFSQESAEVVFERVNSFEYLGILDLDGTAKVENDAMHYYVDKTAVRELTLKLFYKEKITED